jgi:hypothetical protein
VWTIVGGMTTDEAGTRPVRQFRVTVTEDLDHSATDVFLQWRSFPCAATKWDGHAWFSVPRSEVLPITSQEALRDLLAALSCVPWQEGARYPRRTP